MPRHFIQLIQIDLQIGEIKKIYSDIKTLFFHGLPKTIQLQSNIRMYVHIFLSNRSIMQYIRQFRRHFMSSGKLSHFASSVQRFNRGIRIRSSSSSWTNANHRERWVIQRRKSPVCGFELGHYVNIVFPSRTMHHFGVRTREQTCLGLKRAKVKS
jgi:hypothetical protein